MSSTPASPWNPPKARLASEDTGEAVFAGFWRRFAAYWIDAILLNIVSFAVAYGIGSAMGTFDLVATLIGIAVGWLYVALMLSSGTQATLGKMAFGIKVTDLAGERISFLRATGRHFASWVSAILLLIGFLMAAFTERKQALHDQMAGTLVVRKDATPEEAASGSGTMKLTWGVWVIVVLLGPMPFFIGIVAAVSIPAYQDFTIRAKLTESVLEARAASSAITQYHAVNGKLPATLDETTYRKSAATPNVADVSARLTGPTIEVRVTPAGEMSAIKGGAVVMRSSAQPPLKWTCGGDGIAARYLPATCRESP